MKKYRVHLSQYGRLYAVVEVEADTARDAREDALDSEDIDWKIAKFSGEGYLVDKIEEI